MTHLNESAQGRASVTALSQWALFIFIYRMTTLNRETERLLWAQKALNDPQATLERASADASFRSYWRSFSDGKTWIVMDAPPDKEDIRPWLDIAQRLSTAGLHAPDIRAFDADLGFILMADLGNRLYLPELNEQMVDALYRDAGALTEARPGVASVVIAREFLAPSHPRRHGNNPGKWPSLRFREWASY